MPFPYVPVTRHHPHPEFAVFGALAHLLADPAVTDVVVNGNAVWIDTGNGLQRIPLWLDESTHQLAQRLITAGGRHVDEVTPLADARVGAVRVHVALAPVACDGPLISCRVGRASAFSLDALVSAGTFTELQANRLRQAVESSESILITGGTGSGKTTVLRALMAEVADTQRIVSLEDVSELQIPHPHAVSLECRQPNIEGAGGVGLAELVRAALRMRPDWLVVGECRGAEIIEFLSALNTGHAGAGTLHANTLHDVPARIEVLSALAGLPSVALARIVQSAFSLVVHLEQSAGKRRCSGIASFDVIGNELAIRTVGGNVERSLV